MGNRRYDTLEVGCSYFLVLFIGYSAVYSLKGEGLASVFKLLGLYVDGDNWGGINTLLFVFVPLHLYLCYTRYSSRGDVSIGKFFAYVLGEILIVGAGIVILVPFLLFGIVLFAVSSIYYYGSLGYFPVINEVSSTVQSLFLGITTLAGHLLYTISTLNSVSRVKIREMATNLEQQRRALECKLAEERKKFEVQTNAIRSEAKQKIQAVESNCNAVVRASQRKEALIGSIITDDFPFNKVASMQADTWAIVFDKVVDSLKYRSRPALKAAEEVREMKTFAREAKYEYKAMLYRYEFLLAQFPELQKYVDDYEALKSLGAYDSVDDARRNYDNVKDWISKEEYEKLSVNERNQLALTNYINRRNKSRWQIGRDYELYIGYLYRSQGWSVRQVGIEETLADMGRDIVAEKGVNVHIVQCKMWGKDKEIHENIICQLYGTSVQYDLERNENLSIKYNIKPVLVTTTHLSATAMRFAKKLGVEVWVIPMKDDFPRIKCNVNNGNKIYHLPFDQQYDRVKIENIGECYVSTVEEAVRRGFRRAYKFSGLVGKQ